MGYVYETLYVPLILGTDKSGRKYWLKDRAHVVHQDMKGHTELVILFGHFDTE